MSILNLNLLKQESEWFMSQTSLFDETNSVTYTIPPRQIEQFRTQFYSNKSELLRPSKNINKSLVMENLMRRCFKKCNKFVLEDHIDYDELNCTLKCSSVHKQAYNLLLDNRNI